jgi:hypothetical protein
MRPFARAAQYTRWMLAHALCHSPRRANRAALSVFVIGVAVSVLLMHGVALSDLHSRTDMPTSAMLHGETTIEVDAVDEHRAAGPHALGACLATVLAFVAVVLVRESCRSTASPRAQIDNTATLPVPSRSLAFLGIQRR